MTLEDQEGFIYRITEVETNRPYYGKKSFWTRRKGKRHSESDWKTYCSSSDKLQAAMINSGGPYKYEILMLCQSKSILNYCEIAVQVYGKALLGDTYNYMLGSTFMGKIPERYKDKVDSELERIRKDLNP